MNLDAIAHEATTKGSGCACHYSQIDSKTGDLKTCLRCAVWEDFINWLVAIAHETNMNGCTARVAHEPIFDPLPLENMRSQDMLEVMRE